MLERRALAVDLTHGNAPLVCVAETSKGFGVGCLGRPASLHELGGAHLEMKRDFALDVVLDSGPSSRESKDTSGSVWQTGHRRRLR